jgi:alpha-tubulin suppressor-like RCC1 family protein
MRCQWHHLRPWLTQFLALLALPNCSEITGIEVIPCAPACIDEKTRIFCDADGKARAETCPLSQEECASPTCEAGACTFKPAVGAPCGETRAAQCNEGFACLGPSFKLATIHRHTCLAADDGKSWCWGENTYRQLGDGTDTPGLHPVVVRGLPGPASQVLAGYGHTCALLRNGEVYCWGNNHHGQCNGFPSEPVATPVPIDLPRMRFVEVAPADKHTCALAVDKTVYCWGTTEQGECGSDPALTGLRVVGPRKVPDLDSVERIVAVKNHTCAFRSKAPSMVCWGSNSHVQPSERTFVNGKLGPAAGDLAYSSSPIAVDIGTPVAAPGMVAEATYAVGQDGRVYAWGENDRLQLGIDSHEKIVRTPTPVMLETDAGLVPLRGAAEVIHFGGTDHCVKMANRFDLGTSFLCWGTGEWGELGAGTEDDARAIHRSPIPVRAVPSTAHGLVHGEDHACAAVASAGRIEAWCYGRPGALGNGIPPAEDGDPPSHWQGAPVVWNPANFAPALE